MGIIKRRIWLLFCGRRKLALFPLLVVAVLVLVTCWQVTGPLTRILMVPPPPPKPLDHFRRSRSLQHYLDNIQILIEPSSTVCNTLDPVPVLVLVSSAPSRVAHRDAIRSTWGPRLPTYFIVGVEEGPIRNSEAAINNYVEAKLHGDMIVYDLQDHYQNLTLKTALMLQWMSERCPQAQFLYKTDDDMIINPWTLEKVLAENADAKMLGYKLNSSELFRDEGHKWYLPEWLCPEDVIPEYLSGPGYLLNGEYVNEIFNAALKVPLVNIEDIYFTYTVGRKFLGYTLTHDSRLSPYKPVLSFGCAYWAQASAHSLDSNGILNIWPKLTSIASDYERNKTVCSFYDKYVSFFVGHTS